MKQYLLPVIELCARCGYTVDTVSCAIGKGRKPRHGDISLCLNCGYPSIFNEEMRRRAITEAEFAAMPAKTRDYLKKAE
ncbi:MAG: hypothetical protein FWD08_00205 [Alphaproteobacteria bacterium]|nr:hypothetical protein [Alphaproteobacteria bacterium]